MEYLHTKCYISPQNPITAFFPYVVLFVRPQVQNLVCMQSENHSLLTRNEVGWLTTGYIHPDRRAITFDFRPSSLIF